MAQEGLSPEACQRAALCRDIDRILATADLRELRLLLQLLQPLQRG